LADIQWKRQQVKKRISNQKYTPSEYYLGSQAVTMKWTAHQMERRIYAYLACARTRTSANTHTRTHTNKYTHAHTHAQGDIKGENLHSTATYRDVDVSNASTEV